MRALRIVVATLALAAGALPPCMAADPAKPAPAERKSAAPAVDASEQAYLTRGYLFVESDSIETYVGGIIAKLLATRQSQGKSAAQVPDVLLYSADDFSVRTDVNDNLLITTRVLRELESEDELAALLGHELAHMVLGHARRKSVMRAFPMGVETAGAFAVAADRMHGRDPAGAYSGKIDDFGKDTLSHTQAVSLLWSDLLAPSWNRRQEREADRVGYDMMRAAGYDPAAFGTLFQRLEAAQARRSERMELLRKTMIQRAQLRASAKAQKAQRAQSAKPTEAAKAAQEMAGEAEAFAQAAGNAMTEEAITRTFDAIAAFNRDYDAPEVRQQALAKHAASQPRARRDKTARSPRFAAELRRGRGGWVLQSDLAAIRTMNALGASDIAKARQAVKPILPKAPSGAPSSAHLNLAIGAWYHAQGRADLAESRARAWLAAKRPPASAYLWRAYYQVARKDYRRAMATLDLGANKVGNAAPFLPHLVSLARAAEEMPRAEQYAMRCAQEDRRNPLQFVTGVVTRNPSPGLYGECIQRLGYEPEKPENAAERAVRHPVETSKQLASKTKSASSRMWNRLRGRKTEPEEQPEPGASR